MSDVDKVTEKILSALRPAIRDEVKRALSAQYEAGRSDMRAAILKAAGEPGSPAIGAQPPSGTSEPETERAPKGLLRELTHAVLRESPGLRIIEIEDRVLARDSRIARKSVGNELRRLKGKEYRQESRRWFLISGRGEMETAEPVQPGDSAASQPSDTKGGESLWTHPDVSGYVCDVL